MQVGRHETRKLIHNRLCGYHEQIQETLLVLGRNGKHVDERHDILTV
jgi:hypothetical protein